MVSDATSSAHDRLRVVIAGGGVAALEALLALRALAGERVAIQLLAPDPHFWFRPLSVLGPFASGRQRVQPVELAELARNNDAEFELGALASVDADARIARTASGAEYEYDALVIACGARATDALPGAFTFRGPGDSDALGVLLKELDSDAGARIVFAVPPGVTWPLPIYELALLTAAHFAARGLHGVELTLVTPEEMPLEIFGSDASEAIAGLLAERGIDVRLGQTPVSVDAGTLALSPTGSLPADLVVALPRVDGREFPGVPHDGDSFIPTDASGRVIGVDGVYAAGDVTDFPIKQGGLAAQQADAVAEAIAAEAGAPVTPQPFRPVLRGLLLTGGAQGRFRMSAAGELEEPATFAAEPLWWPPGKIVGKYLAPFLAERANVILSPVRDIHFDTLAVEVELTTQLR